MPQLENNKKTLLFSYTLHSGNWHNSFIFLDSLVYWATAFNNVESLGLDVQWSPWKGQKPSKSNIEGKGIRVQPLFNGRFIWISAVSPAAPLSWNWALSNIPIWINNNDYYLSPDDEPAEMLFPPDSIL